MGRPSHHAQAKKSQDAKNPPFKVYVYDEAHHLASVFGAECLEPFELRGSTRSNLWVIGIGPMTVPYRHYPALDNVHRIGQLCLCRVMSSDFWFGCPNERFSFLIGAFKSG